MTVTSHSFHHHEHMGRVHYFCGAGCKTRFATHALRYTQTGAIPKWKGLLGWLFSH